MTHQSQNNNEYIFDVPFEVDEVENAIKCLPTGKAAGPDGVTSEHFELGGKLLTTWITNIFKCHSIFRVHSSITQNCKYHSSL